MFGNRRKRAQEQLDKIERDLDRIWTALVVRDPGTSLSAEAYEGLRRQVIAGASARQAHVVQLAEFDVALRRGSTVADLRRLSDQWLSEAGVTVIDDPTKREVFDSAVSPETDAEVELPAYLVAQTQQLVRQGRLRERLADDDPQIEGAPLAESPTGTEADGLGTAPSRTNTVGPEVRDADDDSTADRPEPEAN